MFQLEKNQCIIVTVQIRGRGTDAGHNYRRLFLSFSFLTPKQVKNDSLRLAKQASSHKAFFELHQWRPWLPASLFHLHILSFSNPHSYLIVPKPFLFSKPPFSPPLPIRSHNLGFLRRSSEPALPPRSGPSRAKSCLPM